MKELSGRVAIVTGASRGVGPVIARALAKHGARIVVAARSAEELEATRARLASGGAEAVAVVADVATAEGRAAIMQGATEAFGRVDILVNNAAVIQQGRFHDLSDEDISRLVAVNLEAPLLLSRLVLPGMIERREGHIVTISSLIGKIGAPYNATYSATKAAVIVWTEALRVELGGSGVGASVICPGLISGAGMFARGSEGKGGILGTSTPEKVAGAVISAIRRNRGEVIVNRGPLRPLFAMKELLPGFGEFMLKRSGAKERWEKRESASPGGMDT